MIPGSRIPRMTARLAARGQAGLIRTYREQMSWLHPGSWLKGSKVKGENAGWRVVYRGSTLE